MVFRKSLVISDECKMWLAKANTTDVMSYAQAEVEFKRACEKIQADVLHALITESKEPAFPDGKAEIVVEIKLLKKSTYNLAMVATNVYAVVYAAHNRKYYVKLDNDGNPKKVYFMGNDIALEFNKGVHIEKHDVAKSCKYCISMWECQLGSEIHRAFHFFIDID